MRLAVLQARMTSSRLPGKVLAAVAGEPMVLRQIERLRQCASIDELVLATSTESSDDELARVAEAAGVVVRRGSLTDVLDRFAAVVDEFEPETLIRLTADCPLCDPEVIDRVVDEHTAAGSDYTSNVIHRSYPQGLDVECVSADAFRRLRQLDLDSDEHEHVTLGIYRRPELFRLHSVEQAVDLSALRWTVDRPDDLAFVREVYDALYAARPRFRQADILELIDRRPELRHVNAPDAPG